MAIAADPLTVATRTACEALRPGMPCSYPACDACCDGGVARRVGTAVYERLRSSVAAEAILVGRREAAGVARRLGHPDVARWIEGLETQADRDAEAARETQGGETGR